MPMRVTKTRLVAFALLISGWPTRAQTPESALAPAANLAPFPSLQSVGAPPAPALTNAVPLALSPAGTAASPDVASSALDYLFNRKPQDGSAAQAATLRVAASSAASCRPI